MLWGYTLYYQNVRWLRTKSSEFISQISTNSYTIVLLTKTWLEDSIPSSQYSSPCHSVFRKDRDYASMGQRYEGGVLTAMDASLCASRRYAIELYWNVYGSRLRPATGLII